MKESTNSSTRNSYRSKPLEDHMGDVEKGVTYLRYDHMANAVAVGLHTENTFIISSCDVELDERAAAVGVIGVGRFDGQHGVSHRNVLRQRLSAVLHTET